MAHIINVFISLCLLVLIEADHENTGSARSAGVAQGTNNQNGVGFYNQGYNTNNRPQQRANNGYQQRTNNGNQQRASNGYPYNTAYTSQGYGNVGYNPWGYGYNPNIYGYGQPYAYAPPSYDPWGYIPQQQNPSGYGTNGYNPVGHNSNPQRPKGYEPRPSYQPKGYEPKSHSPKGYDPNPYPPKGYEPKPHYPKAYNPNPYPPKGYEPKPYYPKAYNPKPYPPKGYEPKPHYPKGYDPEPYYPKGHDHPKGHDPKGHGGYENPCEYVCYKHTNSPSGRYQRAVKTVEDCQRTCDRVEPCVGFDVNWMDRYRVKCFLHNDYTLKHQVHNEKTDQYRLECKEPKKPHPKPYYPPHTTIPPKYQPPKYHPAPPPEDGYVIPSSCFYPVIPAGAPDPVGKYNGLDTCDKFPCPSGYACVHTTQNHDYQCCKQLPTTGCTTGTTGCIPGCVPGTTGCTAAAGTNDI